MQQNEPDNITSANSDGRVLKITNIKSIQDNNTDVQKEIFEYFAKKTDNKRLARRADLEPMEIVKILPNIFLLEIIYDNNDWILDLSFRLMGTAVTGFYGERTGKKLSDFGNPLVIERVMSAVKQVNKSRLPICTISESVIDKKTHCNVHLLFMPLVNDEGKITQIFATFELEDKKH